jgi:hypothetical protein
MVVELKEVIEKATTKKDTSQGSKRDKKEK